LVRIRTLIALVTTGVALMGCVSAATAAEQPTAAGSPYRLLQMNLCSSGYARCYAADQYPKVLDDAIGQLRAVDPNAVTLNETCSGDAERIAAETGYQLRFALVIYRGALLPCRNPDGRGIFGIAVLTKEQIRTSTNQAYAAQAGPEERRWLCAVTVRGVTVCASHLSTRASEAARAANEAQCQELRRVLARYVAAGPTVFGGDVNRLGPCAAPGMAALTDAAAGQLSGIQHVYLSSEFRSAEAEVVPAAYTDHDFLVARSRLAQRPLSRQPPGRTGRPSSARRRAHSATAPARCDSHRGR
jgi:endonuclease/exonuclease/phosphatase family metal-dependent hydrolase